MKHVLGTSDELHAYSSAVTHGFKFTHEVVPTGGAELYYTPAFTDGKGRDKDNILGTHALWVDVDSPAKPSCTLPPSLVVWSGHGWHYYWYVAPAITDRELIESYNKILIRDLGGDSDNACWNCNRLLRVPGSSNNKEPAAPVVCEIRSETGVCYTADDFVTLDKLDKAARHKIKTGDSRGYKSRSERDWAVVSALVRAGGADSLIHTIFAHNPCGDKVRDETTAAGYLDTTITKARSRKDAVAGGSVDNTFEKREDGYYVGGKRGARRVSTFTIDPRILLDGSILSSEDALVGSVTASGHEWKDIVFTRSAFSGILKMDKETPVAAWQWLGRDDDVRHLLPHLMTELQAKGLPRSVAAPAIGLYNLKDVWYFVGDKEVISASETWPGYTGPIGWLPSKAEHPKLSLEEHDVSEKDLAELAELLPQLNEEEVIWPLLGWYASTALKPWLEVKGYRFPILNVSGTRGSGKTTLIQRVLMPLFGQKTPKSYDAGTTKFVMLSCLGSTNAVPIAFSEFRYESVEKFLRYILLSYDSGHDPRGRADQSTVDYILSAPFSVDGEDLIADPAARERIVVAALHPNTISEGGIAYDSFKRFRASTTARRTTSWFGGYYLRYILSRLATGDIEDLLLEASRGVFQDFPGRLPDRVRNNHIVTYLGIRLFCDATGISCPSPTILTRSINSVFNVGSGRSRTLADDFVEDATNAVPCNVFKYVISEGVFWIQISSAHGWWTMLRRRMGKTALERDAIGSQLKEAPYYVEARLVEGTWMHGINLAGAQDAGLDIPRDIHERTFSLKF